MTIDHHVFGKFLLLIATKYKCRTGATPEQMLKRRMRDGFGRLKMAGRHSEMDLTTVAKRHPPEPLYPSELIAVRICNASDLFFRVTSKILADAHSTAAPYRHSR